MANVESRAPVIDIEALLKPVSEEKPAGESQQYSGLYDEIREARRSDDLLAQGQWQHEPKLADYRKVISLAIPALTSETKDLQISAWLAEALTKEHGFVGLRDSLVLLRRLQEDFWETLYPEIDEGDMEGRANAIEWMESQTAIAVKTLPMTGGEGFTYLNWEESRNFDIPENIDALDYHEQEKMKALKAQAAEENRKTGDMWRAAKAQTNRAFCEELNLVLEECRTECAALDRTIEEKYDRNQMPGLRNLKKSLEDIGGILKPLLEEKRQQEPDAADEAEAAVTETAEGENGAVQVRTAAVPAGAITSREDALKRLSDVCEYFKKHEPHSPVSYLIQRAVKWGKMPLENWLQDVIKDETVIFQIRQTLGFNTKDPDSTESQQ
ncbi:MAG TPA: type VI secretion system protein TssA [Pyrinomonadaceae bacterium]|nr:type VI secretion system protein TssA [Pyrinomonadaceae bacterium]